MTKLTRRTVLYGLAAAAGSTTGCSAPRDSPRVMRPEPDISASEFARVLREAPGKGATVVELRAGSQPLTLTTPLRIPEGVELRGVDAPLIRSGAPLHSLVRVSNHASMSGLHLHARHSVTRAVVDVGNGRGARQAKVTGCTITGQGEVAHGVRATGHLEDITVEGNSITSPDTAISIVGNGSRIAIRRNTIRKWLIRGIYVVHSGTQPLHKVVLQENDISEMRFGGISRYPLVVTGTPAMKVEGLFVCRNRVVGAYRAWPDPEYPGTADQIAVQHARQVEIARNTSIGGGDVGITVAHCYGAEIHANRCLENDTAGIYVGTINGSTMSGIVIRENECVNNGQNRLGNRRPRGRAGIRVSNTDETAIVDNAIRDTQNQATQLVGITLEKSPEITPGRNTIEGVPIPLMRFSTADKTGDGDRHEK